MIYDKLFYQYFKKDYLLVISLMLVLLIINPLQSVYLSRLYGNLFDNIYKNNLKKINTKYNILNVFENIKSFNLPGVITIICLVYFLIFILFFTKNYLTSIILPRYFKYSREVIYSNYIKKYSNDFKDVKIGEIFSKTFELCMSLGYLFLYTTNFFIPSITIILALTIYFLYIDYKTGIIYFLSCASIFIIYYLNLDNFINITKKSLDNLYVNNEKINDKLSNLLNIYINNKQDDEILKLINDESLHRIKYTRRLWFEKRINSLVDFIIVISVILILLLSYYNFSKRKINTISFISIIVLLGTSAQFLFSINSEVSVIIYHYSVILTNKNLLNEIFNVKQNKITNKELVSGKIEFKDINFSYNNKYIFKNFNYSINNGEKIAIIGQSGSGKTTLMKLLIHLHEPQKGKIFIQDININNIDTQYLRNKIIYVNQRTTLFNRSVVDNMIYGSNKNRNDVIKLLNKYDLKMIFDKLSNNIDSYCGVNGNNLSMGMQKITIIIRGILKEGIIYIFDEPLTSLDSVTRKKVIKMLMSELKNKTLIVITHDKEIIPYMDKSLKVNKFKN